jgi:hypothetical protein
MGVFYAILRSDYAGIASKFTVFTGGDYETVEYRNI